MLKNHLLIAIRNFSRNKIFSLINISSLAIGISAALVIYLIVQYDLSFDKFHPDRERIFRVVSKISWSDFSVNNSGVPVPTAKALKTEGAGVSLVTHFFTGNETKVSMTLPGNQSPVVFKKQNNIVFADEDFFKIFQYEWLAGSPLTALNSPFQLVLTESRAKTYFGNLTPGEIIGRNLLYNDSIHLTVAGIVRDFVAATDFTFKEFISRQTIEKTGLKEHWGWEEWGSINSSSQMFVKLEPLVLPGTVEKQLMAIREKYRSNHKDEPVDGTVHSLQPLNDIHFNAEFGAFDYNARQASKKVLFGLLIVAFLLLSLGCINFINLSTAQASQRAKEIGIRKTMGGGKPQLILQFLIETFAFTVLATLLSLLLAPWLLHVFKDFLPEGVSLQSIFRPHVWWFLGGLTLLVSFLAGLYPAFILSDFKPVTVLKNQAYSGTAQTRKAMLRKTLTVTQFVISQVLLIATLVVGKQIHFSLNKDLGYKKDAIVFLNTRWNFYSNEPDNRSSQLYNKMKGMPEIELISLAGSPPASNNTSTTSLTYDDGTKKQDNMVEIKYADANFFDLYKLKLLAGTTLQPSDTMKEFVINETYCKLLGFQQPGDAIGRFIDKGFKIPIVGVVADFHTKSTQEIIKPLAFSTALKNSRVIHFALKPRGDNPDSWNNALKKAENLFKEIYPEDEFSYKFFDETIAAFYKSEQNTIRLLKWAAGLCVFISCLGLLGLVVFTTIQRTKEIGVRKVLGASVTQIIGLLSKDFLLLVILAFIIAAPIAWWMVNQWLEDYAYRVELGWILFVTVGLAAVIIALITISFQAVRAAMANPTNSLRTE